MKTKFLRAVALLAVLGMFLCGICACANSQNQKTVATMGEYEIPYEQLRFITMFYKADLDALYGDGNAENGTIWEDAATAEAHRAELEELVWSTVRNNYAVLQACSNYKIGREAFDGKEVKAAVDEQIDLLISEFASKSEYKDFLKENYATESLYRFYFALDEMKYLLHAAMQKEGAFFTDEQVFEEWLMDGNSAYVQHFRLAFEDDAQKETNRTILENARQKLIKGEWTLAECINLANDDLSNVAPFYVVRGVHKDVLVDAAVELDEGDVSEIIEVENVLYVLVRMEETPIEGANGTEETPLSLQLTNLLLNYQWAIVGDAVEIAESNTQIELTDYGKSIDLVAMK